MYALLCGARDGACYLAEAAWRNLTDHCTRRRPQSLEEIDRASAVVKHWFKEWSERNFIIPLKIEATIGRVHVEGHIVSPRGEDSFDSGLRRALVESKAAGLPQVDVHIIALSVNDLRVRIEALGLNPEEPLALMTGMRRTFCVVDDPTNRHFTVGFNRRGEIVKAPTEIEPEMSSEEVCD